MLFFLTSYLSKNPENTLISTTVFNIDKNNKCFFSWAANQYIRMISEGSCDTEDWNKFSFDHRNKLLINIYSNRKQLFEIVKNISQYYCFTVILIK